MLESPLATNRTRATIAPTIPTSAHISHAGKNAPNSRKVGALFGIQPLSVANEKTTRGIRLRRVIIARTCGRVAVDTRSRYANGALAPRDRLVGLRRSA